jgi:hypothetical protein
MATATKTLTFKPHRYATLEDIDGRLAIVTGTTLLKDRPIQEVRYKVSIHRTSDEYIAQFVGEHLTSSSRYSDVDMGNGRLVRFEWEDWDIVRVEETCPKPKGGKEYGWRWDPDAASYQNRDYPERTGWVKENYPRCTNCHETFYANEKGNSVRWSPYHDPSWTVGACGWCHRGGICDLKGVCKPYSE